MTTRHLALSLVSMLLALGVTSDAMAGNFASILACEQDDAQGPVVAFFERTDDEIAACESGSPPTFCAAVADIETGVPCAEALAAIFQSEPEAVHTSAVQGGRPLIIIAEDIEGEAIATLRPIRPQSDVIFTFGEDDGVLVGCDFYARVGGTRVAFDQTADGELIALGDSGDTSCAARFTMFLNDGTPLRSSVSVAPGSIHAEPVPAADQQAAAFDSELSPQVARTFGGAYYIATVTHRF